MTEAELRRALQGGQLCLHLQPVVRASTGLVVGAEALVRWQHPTLGLLAPGAFLPLARRTGLLEPLGEWVLGEAIAQRATWPEGYFVSINLSPAELASAPARDLVGRVRRACERSGVAPSDVWVEVTEQPIDDVEPTIATLTALRELGVRVVLDDFGSGYASLTRLRDLPFDVCKLDRSFVAGMAGSGGVRVVRAAVAVARVFGTEVVAEGIETAEQLEQLGSLGCDLLQGFHLHRPGPADEVRRLLVAQAAAPSAPSAPAPAPGHRCRTPHGHAARGTDGAELLAGGRLVRLDVDAPLEVALDGDGPWHLDPAAVAGDPARYVRELRSALAETALAVRAQTRLEEELQVLQERIEASERFGTMVVHEIRNPASVLALTLDALRDEHGGSADGEVRDLLDLAASSARAIAQLAAELLRAAKLEATDFASARAPIDLAEVIAAGVERTHLLTGREVRSTVTGPLPPVLADAERQLQVLLNLLDNAVTSSPPGSPVHLDVQVRSDHLEVGVADAGPGVAPYDRERLFEPFTRLGTPSERDGGAGLGLYVVDRLVRAHGGRVWVEDGPLGGAVFRYTVPLAVPSGPSSPLPDRAHVRMDAR